MYIVNEIEYNSSFYVGFPILFWMLSIFGGQVRDYQKNQCILSLLNWVLISY